MSSPYVGEIRMFAGNFAPVGWMLCQGQLLPISEYDTLFNLIGTTYGGDGQSTFALPNLQSRVPIHQGTNAGTTFQIGESGGSESVTLTVNQIPNHNHQLLATNTGPQLSPLNGVPAVASLFGVILYLTRAATRQTLRQLAGLAAQSEVTITYTPPPDGTADHVAMETRQKASPTVDASGESFIGDYHESEIERLCREAGFRDVIHHPLSTLNARYFDGRPDGLRLHPIEQLLTAVV